MNIYAHNDLFLDNKYTKWYYAIIEKTKSQDRKKLKREDLGYIYYEAHHVLPKCIFPEYIKEKWNLVLLTAREHFIVHALLCKMMIKNTNEYYKMYQAFSRCSNNKKYTSKIYDKLKEEYNRINRNNVYCHDLAGNKVKVSREEFKRRKGIDLFGRIKSQEERIKLSKASSERKMSEETKEKLRNANKRRSPEILEKIRQSSIGRKHTEDTKIKMSNARKGKKHTEECKEKIRQIRLGKKHTEESKRKMSEKRIGIPKTKEEIEKRKGRLLTEEHKENIRSSVSNLLWWNNGIKNKRSKIHPGEGWIRGKIKKLKFSP